MAEIRETKTAQKTPEEEKKEQLYEYFTEALVEYGEPFTSAAREEGPQLVVAGLILDSHWNQALNTITGHAALGGCARGNL